jgi:hypothetical protein
MNTYYLRTVNYPQLLEMGVKLGVLAMTYEAYDEEGLPIGDGTPYATDCGYLDYIGIIERPTGETETNEFGMTVAVTTPITNPDGTPYIHANLITPYDIRALAEASTDPEIQAALTDIAGWFVVDAEGNATIPNHPHRVFG